MRTDKICNYHENIDIAKWAQEVHQQKILELKHVILQKNLKLKTIYRERRKSCDVYFMEENVQRLKIELKSLEEKLMYLKTKQLP